MGEIDGSAGDIQDESDAPSRGEDIQEGPEKVAEKRRRWWPLLIALLLLLLLGVCCSAISITTMIGGGTQKAAFVARNGECLQCHQELIPEFDKTTVHSPFAIQDCTTCHTPHGELITVTLTTEPGRAVRMIGRSIRWVPITWWFKLLGADDVIAVESTSSTTSSSTGSKTTSVSTTGTPQAESLLTMPESELCWMCHGNLGGKLTADFVHQPFEAGRCTTCHNPHASDYTGLLTEQPDKICFTCHPMGIEFAREQTHDPAARGHCTDCHDPHGSDFRGMIVARQGELCFRCHPSVAVKSNMSVQHAPFANDACTSCHQPHGSNFRPLLVAEQPRLCYGCHPAIQDSFSQPSSHPIDLGATCAGCHDPHAAQYPGLIDVQSNGLCYECHSTMRARYTSTAHKGQVCVTCHTPHGSRWAPMLVAPNPDLCLRCHAAAQFDESRPGVYRNNHPVRPNRWDVNAQEPLTCTSTCHNPHGTLNYYMLRVAQFPEDGNCIICHMVTSTNKVGVDY